MPGSRASGSDGEEWESEGEALEREVLDHIPTLPNEVQDNIISLCDIKTLSRICMMSKEWNMMYTPLLWRHLDFVEAFSEEDRVDATRLFFSMCDGMREDDPDRFATLASHVRTLDVGRLIGINIIHGKLYQEFDYFDDPPNPSPCVFDVIAHFKNLESLSVYIKNWWGYGSDREDVGKALTKGLTKLKSVKVGGQMPPKILSGLVALGEQLKDLTLMNLISIPGQDSGPEPVTFLTKEDCKGLTGLEKLHLCKLAQLDGDPVTQNAQQNDGDDDYNDASSPESYQEPDYVSGMRWEFPREGEEEVLEEWVLLLQHTSKTLRNLTLENRYLCSYGWDSDDEDPFIKPGETHPANYGEVSIRESQRQLFPVLFSQEWPHLEELTLVGMGTKETVDEGIAHFKGKVRVEQKPARFVTMKGDVTPEEISTPVEFD